MGKQSASPYLKVPVPVLRLARVSWNGRTNCCDRRHQPGDLFLLQAGSPTLTVPACGIWVVRTSCGLSWFPWHATKAAGTFYEPQIKCHWRLKCLYEEKEDEKQPGNLNRGGGFPRDKPSQLLPNRDALPGMQKVSFLENIGFCKQIWVRRTVVLLPPPPRPLPTTQPANSCRAHALIPLSISSP